MFKGRFQQTKKNQKRKFENKMSSCTFYTHLWCNGSIWLSKSFGIGSNPVRCAKTNIGEWIKFQPAVKLWRTIYVGFIDFGVRTLNGNEGKYLGLRNLHPPQPWWCSSVGRALDWRSRCQWFDSTHYHTKKINTMLGSLVVTDWTAVSKLQVSSKKWQMGSPRLKCLPPRCCRAEGVVKKYP